MNYLEAVETAIDAYEQKPHLDRDGKIEWVKKLAEFKVFSNAQITELTGMRAGTVTLYTGKTSGTGGRLNPDALGLVADFIKARNRGEVSYGAVKKIHDSGISIKMLARLTGLPESTLSFQSANAEFVGG